MTNPVAKNGYITWAQFLRCVIYGGVFLVGLSGGVVAWAMSTNGIQKADGVRVLDLDRRVVVIEGKLDGMDGKLDAILRKVDQH